MKFNTIANDRLKLSQIGLGTGPLGGLYVESPRERAMQVLEAAWQYGIRYFDTAPFYGYGLAERRVGDFLQGKSADEWVLSTKVGRLLKPNSGPTPEIADFVNALKFGAEFDYTYDGIMRSIEDSYARLGLTKIDVAYVHDIGQFAHSPEMNAHYMAQLEGGGFRALDSLRSSGAIKAWGIGVNEVAVCHDVMARADLDCILLAGRYSLLDHTGADLVAQCGARDVAIIAGGIFNSGILATGPTAGAHFDYQLASADIKSRVGAMQDIAKSHGHSLIQAALQFPIQAPEVSSMLLGVDTVEKLHGNINDLAQPLPSSAWAAFEPHAFRG
ncbi:aldo/keto reductase [Shimia sp. Alg240-R146]|uniref:aldo/keto reductase n=1 Tax=Shimia sp. Alg240-R146 TaxID=2993449 RepID=UPI0022E24FCF|nr:aldo/keto reductase [Shimia sp. Alg240-R146]